MLISHQKLILSCYKYLYAIHLS